MRLSIFTVYPASKYFTWQLLWITTRDEARSTFSLSLFLYCFLYPYILLHFGASCTTLLTDFYQSLFGKCIFPLLKILFYFFFYLKKKKSSFFLTIAFSHWIIPSLINLTCINLIYIVTTWEKVGLWGTVSSHELYSTCLGPSRLKETRVHRSNTMLLMCLSLGVLSSPCKNNYVSE